MGAPTEDAVEVRRVLIKVLRRAEGDADALFLMEWFRRYLNLSGLVYRHDKTLEKHGYGSEVSAEVRAGLVKHGVKDTRALMIKTRVNLGNQVVISVLLERGQNNWLVIDRMEPEQGPAKVLTVGHLDTARLLRRCATNGNQLKVVSSLLFGFYQELRESSLTKLAQAQHDLVEAGQFETWSEMLNP